MLMLSKTIKVVLQKQEIFILKKKKQYMHMVEKKSNNTKESAVKN